VSDPGVSAHLELLVPGGGLHGPSGDEDVVFQDAARELDLSVLALLPGRVLLLQRGVLALQQPPADTAKSGVPARESPL